MKEFLLIAFLTFAAITAWLELYRWAGRVLTDNET